MRNGLQTMKTLFSLRALMACAVLWSVSAAAFAQTVTITAPANNASYPLGSQVTVTATKTGVGAKIRFLQNSSEIGIDSVAPYVASFTPAAPGTYVLEAELLSFANNVLATAAPVTITVTGSNTAPTIALTSPSAGATGTAAASFLLSADAADSDGSIASVKFYADGTLLNTDTTAPYSFSWTGVAAGSYGLTAVAADNSGATTTSSPVNVTVTNAPTTLTLTRSYVYDPHHRLCKVIEPERGATVIEYDAAGNIAWTAEGTNLTSTTDCQRASVNAGDKVTRSYDAMNRVTAVETPGHTADVTTTYYADGAVNTLTAANPGGNTVTTTYTYNKRRLLIGETSANGATSVFSLGYGYNANGHLGAMTYPDGKIVSYAPDALGRATAVTDSEGRTYASGITYYPNGAIAGFTYGNGIVHTLTKNARQLPSRSQDMNGATAILDDTYTFDENGNVSAVTDGLPATATNRSRSLGYDALDRLTLANAAHQWGTATFSYDALDNLRSADVGTRQYRYTYDANNRLLNVKNPAGVQQFAFTYDARGNTLSKGSQAYAFDHGNRLNQVTGSQVYRYDGQGRRVQTTDVADGKTTFWIYSQSGQVLYTSEARRNQNISYIYLGNTQVATKTVAWAPVSTTTIAYQHTDSLGSIVAETAADRSIVKRNSYEPYGKAWNSTIDGTGYTGHVMDQATGLTYMQQRYYDPAIGRFLSTDTIPSATNDAGKFNRYWYAANNPYRFVDPDGRDNVLGITVTFAPNFSRREAPTGDDIRNLSLSQKSVDLTVKEVMSNGSQKEKDGMSSWRVQYDGDFPVGPESGGTADTYHNPAEVGDDGKVITPEFFQTTYYSNIARVANPKLIHTSYGMTYKGGDIGLKVVGTHEYGHANHDNQKIDDEDAKEKDANNAAWKYVKDEGVKCPGCGGD